MEKLVAELKQHVQFKDTTEVGDLVLLVAKEPQMLSVPPQPLTWTLRVEQFTGREIFTMGGEDRFVKAVQFDVTLVGPTSPPLADKKSGLRLVK
ncbi:MAG: hypothetical protein JRJ37_01800 [Deltaproteobacteria bacterium]|nr:hypothetical protein [Deltaproteobacteria bacterium]